MSSRRFWKYAVPVGIAAATALFAPQASAETSPDFEQEVQNVHGAVLDAVHEGAASAGIDLDEVEAQVNDSVDAAVEEFVPQDTQQQVQQQVEQQSQTAADQLSAAETATQEAAQGAAQQANGAAAQTVQAATEYREKSGPNYWVRDDLVSKTLAAKPTANTVVNRVPGSTFDAPRKPKESNEAMERGHSLYGPGTPIYVGDSGMCTMTVTGVDSAGRMVGITAGHCGQVGDTVTSADSWEVGPSGTIVSRNPELDYAVVELGSNAEVTNEYNNVKVNSVGGTARPGEVVCKTGVATNETCGVTLDTNRNMQVNQVCAMAGDSGAPLYRNGRVVGMINGGIAPLPFNVSCMTPWQGALHTPTASVRMDAVMNDINRKGGVGSGLKVTES